MDQPGHNIIVMEDWTHCDPKASELRKLRLDVERLARAVVRLRRIERAAEQVVMHHADGHINPVSPLACQAMVELGSSLVQPVAWRRG